MVWLLLVAGWRTWCWECCLLSGLPSYLEASGAGATFASIYYAAQVPAILRERESASDSVL